MKSYNSENLSCSPVYSLDPKIVLIFGLIFAFPYLLKAKIPFHPNSGSTDDKYIMAPNPATAILLSSVSPDETSSRENRCLQTAKWIGAIAGSAMGLMHLYWRATGVSGTYGPMWKNMVTALPSVMIGAYVGARSTEWATRRMIKGNPKPGKAALKGVAYGFIDGAIIGTACLIPLLTMGHTTGTIKFREGLGIIEIIGAATMGGIIFGGMTGATIGIVYGPCVSVYMKF